MHILWLIIKFILILLGIVLGLVLLAVLLLLFCPVRYELQVEKDSPDWKQVKGSGGVSWLFRGIQVKAFYQSGSFSYGIYLFGIPLEKLLKRKSPEEAPPEPPKPEKPKQIEEEAPAPPKKKPEPEKPKEKPPEKPREKPPEKPKEKPKEKPVQEKPKETPPPPKKEAVPPKEPEKTEEEKTSRLGDTYTRISEKIQQVKDKLQPWVDFLNDPATRAALVNVKNQAWKLIKHLLPTKLSGDVIFDSEDPSVTGTVLAVLGITIPIHRNQIQIHPLFEGENRIEGNVSMAGRVYGFVLLEIALILYFDKNIRFVIAWWKQKKRG